MPGNFKLQQLSLQPYSLIRKESSIINRYGLEADNAFW
jgi:hypothetical protein